MMSLLFNTWSRFVIVLLPRSKRLLISWLPSPSAVILEPLPPKIKSITVSLLSPSICHKEMELQRGTITHQSGWLLSKSLQAINAGEGVEKREPSYTVGGNAN